MGHIERVFLIHPHKLVSWDHPIIGLNVKSLRNHELNFLLRLGETKMDNF